jgi:hypothetical protein
LDPLTGAAPLRLAWRDRTMASWLRKRGLTELKGLYGRLLDQANYKKSVDQMLALLRILDCDVDLIVKQRVA